MRHEGRHSDCDLGPKKRAAPHDGTFRSTPLLARPRNSSNRASEGEERDSLERGFRRFSCNIAPLKPLSRRYIRSFLSAMEIAGLEDGPHGSVPLRSVRIGGRVRISVALLAVAAPGAGFGVAEIERAGQMCLTRAFGTVMFAVTTLPLCSTSRGFAGTRLVSVCASREWP